MLPDRVSNPGPLTYKSDALPIALRGPASQHANYNKNSAELWALPVFILSQKVSYGDFLFASQGDKTLL